jgi:hypothetical protein
VRKAVVTDVVAGLLDRRHPVGITPCPGADDEKGGFETATREDLELVVEDAQRIARRLVGKLGVDGDRNWGTRPLSQLGSDSQQRWR